MLASACRVYRRQINVVLHSKVIVPFTSNNDDSNSPIFLGYNINHYVFLQPKPKKNNLSLWHSPPGNVYDQWWWRLGRFTSSRRQCRWNFNNSATSDRRDFTSRSDDVHSSSYDIGLLAIGDNWLMTRDDGSWLGLVSDRSFNFPKQMVAGIIRRGKSSSAGWGTLNCWMLFTVHSASYLPWHFS